MRLRMTLTCLVLSSVWGWTAAATSEPKRPLDSLDEFSLQWASDPQISPDGKTVAYVRHANDIQSDRELTSLWIVDTATGADHAVDTVPGAYAAPRWSPTGDRLAYVFAPDGAPPQLIVRAPASGSAVALTSGAQSPHDITWSPDGQTIAFLMRVPEPELTLGAPLDKPAGATWAPPLMVIEDVNFHADGKGFLKQGRTHLFVVASHGGSPRQVTSGTYNETGPLAWTPDGSAILLASNHQPGWQREPMDASGSHARHLNIFRVDVATGASSELNPGQVGIFRMPKASPDGTHVAYLGYADQPLGTQDSQVMVGDRDGHDARPLTGLLDRPVTEFTWASDSRSLYVSYVDRGIAKVAQFSLSGAMTPVLEDLGDGHSLLDLPYSGGESSVDRSGAFAYIGGGAARPPELYLSRKGRSSPLTHLNDSLLARVHMSEVTPLAVKSSVGQTPIDAWELLPPAVDRSRRYPLILEIHGGPYASYGPVFSMEDQRFAAAGYVVVYANPRGSTSYGETFANLIHRDYPGHDFDDLMSVVDAAIEHGPVDAHKLFVTGQSGGGVLTAWIVGNTSRFSAAVAQSPVVDWTSWAGTADVYAHVARNWFPALPWEDHENYWRRSPLSRVASVTTPTLLMVGDQDLRTTTAQAVEFYQALQLANKTTGLVLIPGASHTMFRPSQLAAQTNAILAWFDRYQNAASP